MKQCTADVAHVFANRGGSKKKGNVSCNRKNYYSYNTVFGQWVDEKVVLIFTGKTSTASSQHQLERWVFPADVHVFDYETRSYYSYYSGCDLIGYKSVWDVNDRMRLIDYYVNKIYMRFDEIKNEPKKNSAKFDPYHDFAKIQSLCNLYKDTTLNKWLKITGRRSKDWQLRKKMVRTLMEGVLTVEEIFTRMYGEKAWREYAQYCKRFRKADELKAWTCKIAKYLGLGDPYLKYGSHYLPSEIRRFTAKERLNIKFAMLAKKEFDAHRDERREKEEQSYRNFYKWVTGYPVKEIKTTWYTCFENEVDQCRNMFNGEEYSIEKISLHCYNWDFESTVRLSESEFDEYKKANDKEGWLRDFYSEVKEGAFNVKAQNILEKYKAGTGGLFERVYRMTDELAASMTAEELAIVSEYIRKQDKYYADKEARRRAEQIRLQREEEERKKEKELQEKLRKEQIDELLTHGIEGARDLWRKHYMSVSDALYEANIGIEDEPQFYDGGNVLMRFNMNKDLVETSKRIRLDIPTCKKFFRLIKIWHEHPEKFKQCVIDTHFSGKYTITSFKNDILEAGCHRIAYAEMERMYNAIMSLEKVA